MLAQLRRRFDFNVITILVLVVIAALPFLTRPGLPRHTDLELHVFRAAEYGEVLRGGVLYPRWAPDFYYGYGYPIFNYYAPLTYAFANVLDALPGVDTVLSVKLVIVAVYALGAYGMYFLARRLFGSTAGVIASAAFVLSPYFLFIDPLMRGDLAEFFALSILPWLFYVFRSTPAVLDRATAGVGRFGFQPQPHRVDRRGAATGLSDLARFVCRWDQALGVRLCLDRSGGGPDGRFLAALHRRTKCDSLECGRCRSLRLSQSLHSRCRCCCRHRPRWIWALLPRSTFITSA